MNMIDAMTQPERTNAQRLQWENECNASLHSFNTILRRCECRWGIRDGDG